MEQHHSSVHVLVSGRVQGVFFRESTRAIADELQLRGWVRNLADGRVEACFSGTHSACEQALQFVNRGPDMAVVRQVEVSWEKSCGELSERFEVRR
jgi:acylphosphatase